MKALACGDGAHQPRHGVGDCSADRARRGLAAARACVPRNGGEIPLCDSVALEGVQ
jgi:hypothetical protein